MKLPLFDSLAPLPLGSKPRDKHCVDCSLGSQTVTGKACTKPVGVRGSNNKTETLLLLFGSPTKSESLNGQPSLSTNFELQTIIKEVRKHYAGNIVIDYAVKCPSVTNKAAMHGTKTKPSPVKMCAQYTGSSLENVVDVLLFGDLAQEQFFATHLGSWSATGAYRDVAFASEHRMVKPRVGRAHFIAYNSETHSNRFLRQRMQKEISDALKSNPHAVSQESLTYEMVTTANVDAIENILSQSKSITFDVETCGKMHNHDFEIVSLSVSTRDTAGELRSFVWSANAMKEGTLTRRLIHNVMLNESILKHGHNVKFDALAVWLFFGIRVAGIGFCTMVLRSMLETEAEFNLEDCAELVGMGGHKSEMKVATQHAIKMLRDIPKHRSTVRAFNRRCAPKVLTGLLSDDTDEPEAIESTVDLDNVKAFAYGFVPPTILHRYNARDSATTLLLLERLLREFNEPTNEGIRLVWSEVVHPALLALIVMEKNGLAVDRDTLEKFIDYLQLRIEQLQVELKVFADINWSAPLQVSELLYTKLKIKKPRGFEESNATDETALSMIRHKHQCVDTLLKLRELSKLNSSYAAGLPAHIRDDGRVHCSTWLNGARTGRVSITEPALQTVPSPNNDGETDAPYGAMSRGCYVPSKGNKLLQFDYSQNELRTAAIISGDPIMSAAFKEEGVDFHLATAKLIAPMFGIDPNEINKSHWLRSAAKVINFAMLYGKSDKNTALDITPALAKAKINKTFSTEDATRVKAAILGNFKHLQQFFVWSLKMVNDHGYCETWWNGKPGRRRNMYQVGSADSYVAGSARRGSGNTPIQGTAADFCTAAVGKIQMMIDRFGLKSKLVLTVHDSIILDTPRDEVMTVVEIVTEAMLSHFTGNTKLAVDVEIGDTWGVMKKFSLDDWCKNLSQGL